MNKTQVPANTTDIGKRNVVPFTKMNALGNDFVLVEEEDLEKTSIGKSILANLPAAGAKLAKRVCDRHFGVGADGLIIVRPATREDCQISWLYFNSDGSVSSMCGNGLRCLARYAFDRKLVERTTFDVETAVGPVLARIEDDVVTTDLGEPVLDGEKIPVSKNASPVLRELISVGMKSWYATCVGMGNPHCVIFESDWQPEVWAQVAPQIQQLPFFPQGVNVEFVQILSRDKARVFVWERGCGPTLACASGAAAVLVAGVLEDRLSRKATIEMPGGPLSLSWVEFSNHVTVTGAVQTSFTGTFDLEKYNAAEGA